MRVANCRLFRQRLRVPLLTMERSFTETFKLLQGDANLTIQVRSGGAYAPGHWNVVTHGSISCSDGGRE